MKNWRTTLIGLGGAVATMAGQLLTAGNLDSKTWVNSIVLALLGVFAKDAGVTGTEK